MLPYMAYIRILWDMLKDSYLVKMLGNSETTNNHGAVAGRREGKLTTVAYRRPVAQALVNKLQDQLSSR